MFISETRLVVRYAETDKMGIVHHSNYPVWFEAGRTDFIRKLGLPYSKIEEMGTLLPLIELKCSFRGASRYEDEILVRTSIKEVTYTRLIFYYEILKNNEPKPISVGETTHVFTNREMKPVNIKKHMPEIFRILQDAANG